MKATILIAFTLLACSTAHAGSPVKDADEAAVAKCTFVQDVQGRTAFGERLKEQAVKNAKEEARAKAEKAGATHIVWGKVTSTDVTTIDAKAYRCGG
jgi:hypothetical protein